MPRSFRIWALNGRKSPESWAEHTGSGRDNALYCYLTHESYLRDLTYGKAIREELGYQDTDCQWVPEEFDAKAASQASLHLVAPFDISTAEYIRALPAYMGAMRQLGEKGEGLPQLLCRADFWEQAFDPSLGSPFLIMGDRLHVHLLWDDGGLWEQDGWNDDRNKRLSQAWRGSGWLERRFDSLPSQEDYAFGPGLEKQLEARLQGLAAQAAGDDEALVTEELERSLCAYLPRVWTGERWVTPFPNNPFTDPGQPRPFTHVAELERLERLLLFDGWLTPWWIKKQGYIQPASLALLYWAAKRQGYAHTSDPEAFIEHYDWSAGAWFGGHLKAEEAA